MEPNPIGPRVASLRALSGIEPIELGELAGLKSPNHVAMIESGERAKRISADTALALADVLGCTVRYLVRGEGDPPSVAVSKRAVARARQRHERPEAA